MTSRRRALKLEVAEIASLVQHAMAAESCSQVVSVIGQASTMLELAQPLGASDESPVDAQADAETVSIVQPASTAEGVVHRQVVPRRPSLVATAARLGRVVGNLRGVAKASLAPLLALLRRLLRNMHRAMLRPSLSAMAAPVLAVAKSLFRNMLRGKLLLRAMIATVASCVRRISFPVPQFPAPLTVRPSRV